MNQYRTALHIFRRDLRIIDNTSLNKALDSAQTVIPCFIFDDRQFRNNDYKSDQAADFMTASLLDLAGQLRHQNGKLYIFSGIAENVVQKLLKPLKIEAVFINRDYTPFSRQRDAAIEKVCADNGVDFTASEDALLNSPEAVLKDNGDPYSVFTAFYNRASLLPVLKPDGLAAGSFFKGPIPAEKRLENFLTKKEERGGRGEALKLIDRIPRLTKYEQQRNFPSLEGTTSLSPHNKFGTVSVREVYQAVKESFGSRSVLIKQLYWRDFFTHIAYHRPQVFGSPFQQKYRNIEWANDQDLFDKWCRGLTGFPIVDAGMRQLNSTGRMHNRVRMITAGFLVKDLHIDWRWGEKYFARHLIDYDPAVNNGNWQWAASTGCDAQPYFRIFNPWLQQKRFDNQCLYVKKWIPELNNIPAETIHKLVKPEIERGSYPMPIVDHSDASKTAKTLFRKAAGKSTK